jgi:hypothetical protein
VQFTYVVTKPLQPCIHNILLFSAQQGDEVIYNELASLQTLPIELQMDISELDPDVYALYPILCKSTAATRFSLNNLEKHGKWQRYALKSNNNYFSHNN